MPKILLGFSIVLISASAVLGFMTKEKIALLQQAVSQAKDESTAAKAMAAKAELVSKQPQEEVKKANDKVAEISAELATAATENQKTKDQVTDLQAKLAEAEKAMVSATTSQVSPTAEGEVPSPVVVQLQARNKELETKLAEKEQLVGSLTEKQMEVENRARGLAEKEQKRQRQFMAKGLEGQILAVNQAWNFVVLNIGDRQGVANGGQMIVTRGGQVVAKIKITNVEPTTAIADVMLGSLPRGAHVQPGDRVVYSGE